MTKRTTYTKAFKLEAIRQLEESDKPRTQIANELGIRRNMLYKWQQQLSNKGEEAFQGSGRKVSKEDQLTTLERENTKLKEEIILLRKAAAYFARQIA